MNWTSYVTWESFLPVKTAKRATPIVPVVKKDGTIRICGDFKSSVNQATHIATDPLA